MQEIQFSEDQRLALAKVLKEVMFADGEVHYSEILYFEKLKEYTGITASDIKVSSSWTVDQAIDGLKTLDQNQKKAVGVMIKEMSMADGKLTNEEKVLIKDIFGRANLEVEVQLIF